MKQSYEDFKNQASSGGEGFENLVDRLEREAMEMTWDERCERIEQIKARHKDQLTKFFTRMQGERDTS